MLEEVGNAVCSQNPIMPCPFLLRAVENTAVYIILYINIYIYIYIRHPSNGFFRIPHAKLIYSKSRHLVTSYL